MSSEWRPFAVEVVFEMRREVTLLAQSEEDAEQAAVAAFRTEFAEEYSETPPSACTLEVYATPV